MIVRCRSGDTVEESRFRVVLNKKGLKRIEPVNEERSVARPMERVSSASAKV